MLINIDEEINKITLDDIKRYEEIIDVEVVNWSYNDRTNFLKWYIDEKLKKHIKEIANIPDVINDFEKEVEKIKALGFVEIYRDYKDRMAYSGYYEPEADFYEVILYNYEKQLFCRLDEKISTNDFGIIHECHSCKAIFGIAKIKKEQYFRASNLYNECNLSHIGKDCASQVEKMVREYDFSDIEKMNIDSFASEYFEYSFQRHAAAVEIVSKFPEDIREIIEFNKVKKLVI